MKSRGPASGRRRAGKAISPKPPPGSSVSEGAAPVSAGAASRKSDPSDLEAGQAAWTELFAQNLHFSISIRDADGRLVYLNPVLAERMRRTPQQVLGATVSQLDSISDEARTTLAEADAEAMRSGQVQVIRAFPFQDENGNTRWQEIYRFPLRGKEGQVLGLGAIGIDLTDRLLAEDKLRESEARFRDLVDGSLQGMAIIQDRRIVFCNQAYAEILGYRDPSQVMQLASFLELVSPHDRDRLAGYARDRLLGKPVPAHYEVDALHKAGQMLRLDTMARRVSWQGAPALQSTIVDITERARAETLLHASEQRFRELVEGSLQGIYIRQGDHLVFINRSFARIFGYERPEELIGSRWETTLSPADRERVDEFYRRRVAGESVPTTYELQGVHRNGTALWLENTVRVVNWHGQPAVQGTLTDITERKRTEAALRESEERFRSLIEGSIQGVAIHRNNRLLFVNQACAWLFGYSTGEELLELASIGLLQAPEERGRLAEFADNRLRGEAAPTHFEFQGLHHDGHLLWMECANSLVQWEGQAAILTTFHDITERKEAEHKLRESQALLQTAFNSIPHDLFVKDSQGRLVTVNTRMERTFGRSAAEMIGRQSVHSGPAPEQAVIIESDQRALAGETVDQIQARTLPDGQVRHFRVIKNPVRDEVGRIKGLVGIAEDITDQMRAEQSFRENQRLLQTIFDTVPLRMFVKDAHGRYVIVNQAMADAFGRAPQEFIGRRAEDFTYFTPEAIELIRRADGNVFQLGQRQETPEEPFQLPDGTRGVNRVIKMPVLDDRGAVRLLVGIADNITDRKRAEDELHANQRLLRTLIDALPQAITVKDRQGRYQLANRSTEKHFGVPPQDMINMKLSDMPRRRPEELAIIAAADERVISKGEMIEIPELLARAAYNDSAVERLLKVPLRDEHGEIIGVVTVVEDITDRKRAEEERLDLERQFQQSQKLESLGVLAGGIAHDFNNLLTGILGNAELALLEVPGTNPVRGVLEDIKAAGLRAAALTRQMLDYTGKGRSAVENLNLNDLIQEIGHLLRVSISRKVEIQYRLGPVLPPIAGDTAQLQQVVMNLITNAAEAIGDAVGTITLTTASRFMSQEMLAQCDLDIPPSEGNYVCLEVQDTGSGMTDEVKSRMFEPFFTTKFAGRGLGLAALLGIVRRHHGTIKIESALGTGTRFQAFFPCAPLPAQGLAASASKRPAWQGSGQILVVDDEPLVRTVMLKQLQALGFDVLLAENGQQALELYGEHRSRIAAVLLDMTMPVLNGLETLAQLQALKCEAPVILCSGYDPRDTLTDGSGPKPDAVLQKPVRMDLLRETLRQLLGAAQIAASGNTRPI